MGRVLRRVGRVRGRAERSERGAALVEAAILLPVILLIVFGAIEFSSLYKDAAVVSSVARAGGRIASAEPRDATMPDDVATAVDSALGSLPTSAAATVWIYDATSSPAVPGSCGSSCVSYSWAPGSHTLTGSYNWRSPAPWVMTQNACTQTGWARVGVYVTANHPYITKLFGAGANKTLKSSVVFRVEPLPSAAVLMSPLARRMTTAVRARRGEEGGFFLVFFTIMLIMMLAVAGLAIDFSNWKYQGEQEQKAADAASLGGAVFLPEDFQHRADDRVDIAAKNGYSAGEVSVALGARANQLKVTIKRDVKSFFAEAIGVVSNTVIRSATSEYQKPIAMGSPSSQFGNDPESHAASGTTRYPGFWANVAGPDSPKENGDAFQAGNCSGGDNCSGGNNAEYDANGYYYTVHVGSGAPGSWTPQVFDPAFVAVGDTCGANDDGSNLAGAAAINTRSTPIPGYPSTGDVPAVRYKPVADANNANDAGLDYCSGDHIFDSGPPPATTYSVLGPASIPGDPNSAPKTPICSVTFPGWKAGMDSQSYNRDLVARLLTSNVNYLSGAPVAGQSVKFGAIFRQWYSICSPISGQGDYFIRVSTTSSSGSGHNRFAMRACGTTSSCTGVSGIGIYGDARMSIYANVGANTLTEFYLARILPGAAGRSLNLLLFDIGDAAGGSTGSLQIVKTTDGVDSTLSNCKYTPPPGKSTGPPWGTFTPTPGSCQITGVSSSQYQGQWVQIQVPIPDSMNSCVVSDPNDCWLRIQYRFSGGVNDTTTWAAYLDGDPVRIVQ